MNGIARIAAGTAMFLMLSGTALGMHHIVKVAKAKDGSYLADASGIALYTFKKDAPGKSACAGDCLRNWPLYYREKVDASGGLDPAAFATITREDGKKQTTYKGMPLYYFAEDQAPGETKGQGFKGVWFLAKP